MTLGYASQPMMELSKSLRQVPFLASLEDSQIDSLVEVGNRVQFKSGELLFRKDEPGHCMYLILEGRVQIDMVSNDGPAAVLRVLEAGQFFGEMALLDGGARSANARTLSPCEFFVFERGSFMNLITAHPELLTRLLSGLTERLRRTDDRYLEKMAAVTQEVSEPLDAIRASVREIKQDLEVESESPVLKSFVQKLWDKAEIIEKNHYQTRTLLQRLSSLKE